MPARRLPWFKLWPEAMRHEKVVLLSDGAFRAWIMTLAAGAEQTTRWRFGSVQHLLRVTGRAEAEIHELISVHLLDVAGNGEVWVHDWRQWQERFASDFTPRTHRNGSANGAPKLPPDVRRETGDVRRETRDTSYPTLPPPAEEGTAGLGAGVARDVVERLAGLPDDLTAKAFHDQAELVLAELGFRCSREVFVDDRGDGQRGRLDLVAERGTERIALELDDRSPRQKSLTKLAGVEDGIARVVVLRCPLEAPLPRPDGIDVVIGAGRAPDDCPGAPPPELAKPTTGDATLWKTARERLRVDMSGGNWTLLVEPLEPLGRAPDGGLRLRAPPGYPSTAPLAHVRKALEAEGDARADLAAIVGG